MKCPQCVEAGQRSSVNVGMSTTTCLGWSPYYDEDGVFHNNNPNKTTTEFRCSNGHVWSETTPKD